MLAEALCRLLWRSHSREDSVQGLLVQVKPLPVEIQLRILAMAIAARRASHEPIINLLLVSHLHARTLMPKAYDEVKLASSAGLHQLRMTVLLWRPELARGIRALHLLLCEATPAVGVEQALLALQDLEELVVNKRAAESISGSALQRMAHTAKPLRLKLDLHDTLEPPPCVHSLLRMQLCSNVESVRMLAPPWIFESFVPGFRALPRLRNVDLHINWEGHADSMDNFAALSRTLAALHVHRPEGPLKLAVTHEPYESVL